MLVTIAIVLYRHLSGQAKMYNSTYFAAIGKIIAEPKRPMTRMIPNRHTAYRR
jgi:hypothetical protein